MTRLAFLIVAAVLGGQPAASQPSGAKTFYTFAQLDTGTFAIDPGGIVETSAGRSANIYFVMPSRIVQEYASDFDCAGSRVLVRSRKIMRSDLSPLRDVKVSGVWEKPDPKASVGIALKLVCDWPVAPAARKGEAVTLPAFLGQTADRLRQMPEASRMSIIVDSTAIGDCIFAKMPRDVSLAAMSLVQNGKPLSGNTEFQTHVEKLGEVCAGRPVAKIDVVFAAISIYTRHGIVSRFPDMKKINENLLTATWNAADPALREPFLSMTALMQAPTSSAGDISEAARQKAGDATRALMAAPELSAALVKTKGLNNDQKYILINQYFSATAMGEAAEARLAAGAS